jgi:hypothetical protein
MVQGNRQLDHAQACAKVAAGLPYAVQQVGPEFLCELHQCLCVQIAQGHTLIDSVQ